MQRESPGAKMYGTKMVMLQDPIPTNCWGHSVWTPCTTLWADVVALYSTVGFLNTGGRVCLRKRWRLLKNTSSYMVDSWYFLIFLSRDWSLSITFSLGTEKAMLFVIVKACMCFKFFIIALKDYFLLVYGIKQNERSSSTKKSCCTLFWLSWTNKCSGAIDIAIRVT